MNARFLALDGLRGFAAVAVLFYHCTYYTRFRLMYGWLAVDLFFLLSGFVLAHAYLRRFEDGLSWGGFMRERFVRLYPLYFAGTALGALSCVGMGLTPFGMFLGLAGIPYLNQDLMVFGESLHHSMLYPCNGAAWSLACEVLINAIFATACIIRVNMRLLLGAGLAIMGGYLLTGHKLDGGWGADNWGAGLVRVGVSFPLGVVLYQLMPSILRHRSWLVRLPGWLPVVIAVTALVCPAPFAHQTPYLVLLILVAFPGIVALASCAAAGPTTGQLFSWLGGISYALYITHLPILQMCRRYFESQELAWIVTALLALPVAHLVTEYFDKWARPTLALAMRRDTYRFIFPRFKPKH